MKIAVFCPNLIGDTVMATPTFRACAAGFPRATIVGVIKPRVAPTLDATSWFDDWIFFDRRSSQRIERTVAVVRRLRRERFQLAVLLPNTFRSAWLAWLAQIPHRIGYDRFPRGMLLTTRLTEARDSSKRRIPTPIVETYLELARTLRCPVDSVRLELATTADDEAAAESALSSLGLRGERRIVCLNTGGAFGPAKSWPTAHFAELARRLVDEAGVSILVLCGPDERDSARDRAGGRPSACREPRRSAIKHWPIQSLRAPISAHDHYRFGPSPFRGSFWHSRHHAVWTDSHRLDADLPSPCVAYTS